MTIGTLTPCNQTMAINEVLASNDIRTVVAEHLGVVGQAEVRQGRQVHSRERRQVLQRSVGAMVGECAAAMELPQGVEAVFAERSLALVSHLADRAAPGEQPVE